MSARTADLLVLGATGFTGRLITKYLHSHPERDSFSFAIGARSQSKLAALREELGLDDRVKDVIIDVLKDEDVEAAIPHFAVVINTVGPFWKWGTPVVRACAKHGTHYVDLTGENFWVHEMIKSYHTVARENRAIIVPCSGYDSIPSDASAYLSVQTLKAHLGPDASVGRSTTAHKMKGGISGGTAATMITAFDEVPRETLRAGSHPYALSPVRGPPVPSPRLHYVLPIQKPTVHGAFWIMAGVNSAVVRRTWGLLQQESTEKKRAYGPQFVYEEMLEVKSRMKATILSAGLFAIAAILMIFPPARWLFKRLLPSTGEGPAPELLEKGFFRATNIASSVPTPTQPQVHVRSVVKGKGDPGYLLTSIMISESALAILSDHDKLPSLAKEGGILTPMSALGDILLERLQKTGRFEYESYIIGEDGKRIE